MGKAGGRSSYITEKREARPAVLRKPSQQGEGEASRLWRARRSRGGTGSGGGDRLSSDHGKFEGP